MNGYFSVLAILAEGSISIPPKNVRKPLIFDDFSGYGNGTLGCHGLILLKVAG